MGRKTVPEFVPEEEDEDVVTEHFRVASGEARSDLLQVNQLSKVYQHLNKKVHAVKKLSVGIPAGEVRLRNHFEIQVECAEVAKVLCFV